MFKESRPEVPNLTSCKWPIYGIFQAILGRDRKDFRLTNDCGTDKGLTVRGIPANAAKPIF